MKLMMAVEKLQDDVKAYLIWGRHNESLEDFVKKYDERIKLLDTPSDYPKQLPNMQNGLKKINASIGSVTKQCPDLSHLQYELLQNAVKLRDALINKLSEKYNKYHTLEETITSEISKFSPSKFSSEAEETLSNHIFELCSEYKNAKYFDSELCGSGKNQFYIDLAPLSFIRSTHFAEQLIEEYCAWDSLPKLQDFYQEVENWFGPTLASIRAKLAKKYTAPVKTQLISIKPLALFTEIRLELKNRVANYAKFERKVQEIKSQAQETELEAEKLTASMPELTPDYIDSLMAINTERKEIEDYNSFYIKRILKDYYKVSERFVAVHSRKKDELGLIILSICNSIGEKIEYAHDSALLADYMTKACELEKYSVQLQAGYASGEVAKLKQRISSMPEYKIIDNSVGYITNCTELSNRTILDSCHISHRIVHNGGYSDTQKISLPSIIREVDLIGFAFDCTYDAKSLALKRYCRQVCGIDEEGKHTLDCLQERVKSLPTLDRNMLTYNDAKRHDFINELINKFRR